MQYECLYPNKMKYIISIFILGLCLSVQVLHAQNACVKKVISGNRIELDTGDIIEYIGVSIPLDSSNHISNSAFELNKKLVEAKEIKLEYDEKENSNDECLLAYVYCGDVFVNAEIIKQGYGIVNIHSPNIKYAESLIKAEREAREQKTRFLDKKKKKILFQMNMYLLKSEFRNLKQDLMSLIRKLISLLSWLIN